MRMVLLAVVLCVAACEDDSGVDTGKRIVDLSETEIEDLCNFVVATQGTGEEECEDGTVTFPTFEECVDDYLSYDETCESTVGDEEACARALAATPCGDPVSCERPNECGTF